MHNLWYLTLELSPLLGKRRSLPPTGVFRGQPEETVLNLAHNAVHAPGAVLGFAAAY